MAQNWDMDPSTGDYLMNGGAPVQTNSLRIPAYVRLKTKRKGWMYAPADDYGSDFHTVKKRRTTDNPSLIENLAASALQPIVDDGRATEVTADATVATRSGVGIETKITDAAGNTERLVLPPVA